MDHRHLPSSVVTPVFATTTGFEDDEVAAKGAHGGPDKAILCYSTAHYPKWREELALPMEPGGLGENLAVDGQDESTVCIGDTYRIGEADLQVTQPRLPCSTLARRWNLSTLVKIVRENKRSGWYVRVLREGRISVGDPIERLARPHPEWTVARTAEVHYSRERRNDEVREILAIPELSIAWKENLAKKQSLTDFRPQF